MYFDFVAKRGFLPTFQLSNNYTNFFSSTTHDLQWRLQVDLAILLKQLKMLRHRNLIIT